MIAVAWEAPCPFLFWRWQQCPIVDPNEIPSQERPSKTQRKREMHARQELGERLVALSSAQLARLALPETLSVAIEEARRMRSHEARRRQLQYVGKLMRDIDYAAVSSAYDALLGNSRAAVALMHRSEQLRDRFIDDDDAVGEFLQENAGADSQWLRAKVRAARQERAAGKAARHSRELYKWLHEFLRARHAAVASTGDGT